VGNLIVTLGDIQMMTKQEMFSKVYLGVIAQGGPAVQAGAGAQESPECMYRTENGRKCAAGQLIPDAEYNPAMEYGTIQAELGDRSGGGGNTRTFDNREYFVKLVGAENFEFLESLQATHDTNFTLPDAKYLRQFVERMENLAHAWGLEVPESV
jgi:hypothetical protein